MIKKEQSVKEYLEEAKVKKTLNELSKEQLIERYLDRMDGVKAKLIVLGLIAIAIFTICVFTMLKQYLIILTLLG